MAEDMKTVQELTFPELLDEIGWTKNQLAAMLPMNERTMRRIDKGETPCPPVLRAWLEKIAQLLRDNPVPEGWRN